MEKNIYGLLFPAYQKLYSALIHLERFNKESNFFDNISAIDGFFNEYRNITFVMQASLKHTEFYEAYEKNRDLYLNDHWFVDKRNETIKQKPFELIKEVVITIYLPFGGFTVFEKKYSVDEDKTIECIISEMKELFCKVDPYEVCFSVAFSFHEADSDINLLKRALTGVEAMKRFMDAMVKDVGEQCALSDQLKEKINNIHLTDVPLDFLLVNDYTYCPQKDYFDRADRVGIMLSLDGKKVASRRPLSELTDSLYFKWDGSAFGSFTLMHAMMRTVQSEMDIMPAIMVVFDDDTYDLDVFDANMKTTMYRKLMETACVVTEKRVVEVCYMSLYICTAITPDISLTSRERIQQASSDILVCASIDRELNEKEYVFVGKQLENLEYVVYVMQNGLSKQLDFSATNLFPIKCAFQKKLQKDSNN